MNQQRNPEEDLILTILLTDSEFLDLCVWCVKMERPEIEFYRTYQVRLHDRIRLSGMYEQYSALGITKEQVEKAITARYAQAVKKLSKKN